MTSPHRSSNQATSPGWRAVLLVFLGGALGVAIAVVLVGSATLTRADFVPLYALHVTLALLTCGLCLGVNTRKTGE